MHLRCVLAAHHPQQRVTSGSSGQPMKIRGKTISSQLPLEYDRFWCCTAEEKKGNSSSRNSSSNSSTRKSSTRSIIQKIIDLWSCTMSVTEAISRVDRYYRQRKYYDHDNDDNIIDKDSTEGLQEEYNAEEGSKIRKINFRVVSFY